MLVHIGQQDAATIPHNAWLRTIEDGVQTFDIYKAGVSREKVGTREFAEAVVKRLGQKPDTLKAVEYAPETAETGESKTTFHLPPAQKKELVGVDVFLDWFNGQFHGAANELGALVELVKGGGLKLQAIANRGVKVYPNGLPDTFTVDHWRCRFVSESGEGRSVDKNQIIALLQRFADAGLDVIKTENLYNFDGKKGYSA